MVGGIVRVEAGGFPVGGLGLGVLLPVEQGIAEVIVVARVAGVEPGGFPAGGLGLGVLLLPNEGVAEVSVVGLSS